MNFVAIDFETANEKRSSPCSIGITVVRDNQIVEEKYYLIRPLENRFAPINIMIHGIRPADVENEPEFEVLWPEIKAYLDDQLVIAHNASFDFSVLRNTLDLYQIPYPKLTYCCTMQMSKHFYSFLENAKLNTVNSFLGYEFSHHHASADASACANILLKISEELGTDSIEQIAAATGVKIGYLSEDGYKMVGKASSYLVSSRKPISTTKEKKRTLSEYFLGKSVVFTGPLRSMSRSEAMDFIYECGGSTSSSVSRKTNVLVTNVKNICSLTPDQMSTKLRKAIYLREQGYQIEIIDEEQFLSLLYE